MEMSNHHRLWLAAWIVVALQKARQVWGGIVRSDSAFFTSSQSERDSGRRRLGGNGQTGNSLFLYGNYGKIDAGVAFAEASGSSAAGKRRRSFFVKKAATQALVSVLVTKQLISGNEDIRPTDQTVGVDPKGNRHVRVQQYMNGKPVEGSSMVVHVRKGGTVFAVNGETPTASDVSTLEEFGGSSNMTCVEAVELALSEYGVTDGTWISECEDAAVLGFDGVGRAAFKRLIGYHRHGEPYQRTLVFADRRDGRLVALHPRTRGESSLRTYDCQNTYDNCVLRITNASIPVGFTKKSVLDAHNFTTLTLDYFQRHLGRESLNSMRITVKSYASVGETLNNAYWDGEACWYGSGDGMTYRPFSMALGETSTRSSSESTRSASFATDLCFLLRSLGRKPQTLLLTR
jgi:Thermolysin metallopeptidase, catalytic domain/Fungalysin/Thermolysin Propeptide Motif